jgi:hypothetical protein
MAMEKVWQWLAILVIAALTGTLIRHITSPKHVVRYELGIGYDGIPAITADIENSADDRIHLSKEVSWRDAVHMVDSLNMNLRKHPIK